MEDKKTGRQEKGFLSSCLAVCLTSSSLPLFFFATTLLFCLLAPLPVFQDADIGWHMATGAWIRDHGTLPPQDVFSFTAGETPWCNFSVLPDLAMSWIFEQGGFPLLFTVTAVMVGIAIYFTTLNVQKTGAGFFSTFLVMMIVTIGLHASATMRPQLVSFVLAPLFYALLARHRHRPDAWIYLLFPLTLLWVNCHAGFMAGFSMIGAFVLEAFVDGLKDRKPNRVRGVLFLLCALLVLWMNVCAGFLAGFALCAIEVFLSNRKGNPSLIIVGALCFLASFINPAGADLYFAAKDLMGMEMREYTLEWKTFGFGQQLDLSFYFLLMVFCARPFSPLIPLADKLLGLGWWLLALCIARYMPLALLLGAPFLARSVAVVVAESKQVARIETFSALCLARLQKPSATAGMVSLTLLSIALASPSLQHLTNPQKILPKPMFYQPQQMDYLLTHFPQAKVMAEYNMAGYLIYEAYRRCGRPDAPEKCDVKVFTDGRVNAVYPAKVLHDYIRINYKNSRHWEKILDRYGVDVLLLDKRGPFYQRFPNPPRWNILSENRDAAVIAAKEME